MGPRETSACVASPVGPQAAGGGRDRGRPRCGLRRRGGAGVGEPDGPASDAARACAVLAGTARPVGVPVSLEIPAIGVRTRLVRLGLTAAGALQVPASTAVAGWYTGSPRPGEAGAAVIAGHVDSYLGPGVFL